MCGRSLRFGILLGLFVLVAALPVAAQELTVRPFLIDRSVEPRSILTEQILLTNTSGRTLVVFATVNEITLDTTGTVKEFVPPMQSDRASSITAWLEISRGRIELPPNATTTVPLTVRVHPNAEAGEYHAFVGFVPASKRYEAEAVALAGQADGVILSLSIDDKKTEALRVQRFIIDRFVTRADEHSYLVELKNEGDLPLVPQGEIIFYDTRGSEIAAAPFNPELAAVAVGETSVFSGALPFGSEIGRYKANLNLSYGERQRANLFDTTSFYLMPWYTLLAIFSAILLVAITVALLLRQALLRERLEDEAGDDVLLLVASGRQVEKADHDIDLKNNS